MTSDPASVAARVPVSYHFLIILTASFVVLIAITYPSYNWDMIGYVAAAHYEDGLRGEALRDRTYGEIRDTVPSYTFDHLTAGTYRRTVFEDPRSLEQQIPFYRVKIAYVEFVRAAGRLGLSYARATFWVSAFFAAMSVVVLGTLSSRMQLPALVLPLIAFGAGHHEVARASSPDATASFFALLAIFFALNGSRWLYVVSAILPFLRTDYLILSALLMIHQYREGQRGYAAMSLIAAIVAYACINRVWGGYGYLTLFNFTLITGAVPFPADMAISERVPDYLVPYTRLWIFLFGGHQFVIYFLAAFVIATEFVRQKASREFWILFVVPFSFLVLHLCLFPLYEDRYFAFAASMMLMGLFARLRRT